MSDSPICRCDVFIHPVPLANPPGLSVVRYRAGDFLQFRQALLRSLPGEVEIQNWRPTAKGDLALQMLEWWAYLADILTFYNERIANESYLRTAVLPESVKRLIRILGYRPRPGIGATGTVAALLSVHGPITIPRGFPIQSKPGPGKTPQTFEVDQDTIVVRPDGVPADPADPAASQSINAGVLLKGSVSTVKENDWLLLLPKVWSGTGHALVHVTSTGSEKDARGNLNTRVNFAPSASLATAKAADYRLLRSTQSIGLWPYGIASTLVIAKANAHLNSIARDIGPGAPLVLELNEVRETVKVTKYSELIWFANPNGGQPGTPPDAPTIGVSIPHSSIGFQPELSASNVTAFQGNISSVVLRFGWRDAGEIIPSPAAVLAGSNPELMAATELVFPASLAGTPILVEDANGAGSAATATGGGSSLTAAGINNPERLALPLRILFDLLPVSRGKTVASEILGGGDASQSGQEFVLQKSPLTYLATKDAAYAGGYKSTLRIWVDDVEWVEAPNFFGQAPGARVFVTSEDESDKTHVLFGDGVNGSRLPTGADNVVAQYRYGSGAETPEAGKLTVKTQPLPGLKSIRNPVRPGGGAEPDPPNLIRQLAPRSILTFDRAVSGDDYEVMAAQTPGVTRARAYWSFDTGIQRTAVTVFVGDDEGARIAAKDALKRASDPNRPVVVKLANPVAVRLKFTLLVDKGYQHSKVEDNVRKALIDPDSGLFGLNRVRIGASVFDSQIKDTCLRVPGAAAVHSMVFSLESGPDMHVRHFPGEGGFYQLNPVDLMIKTEARP